MVASRACDIRLSSRAAAAETTTTSSLATKAWRCLCCLRSGVTRNGFSDNYYFAFLQITGYNFSCRTIAETYHNSSWLRFLIGSQNPDHPGLASQHRRRRRSDAVLLSLSITRCIVLRLLTTLTLTGLVATSSARSVLTICALRSIPQCSIGHLQYVVPLVYRDRKVCRHTRFQLLLRIVDIEHYVVRDDVLHVLRIEPKFLDRSFKFLAGKCIYRKGCGFRLLDQTNVRLVYVCNYLHLG